MNSDETTTHAPYTGTSLIHVDRRRRGNIPRNTWRWMKHRAAIEPTLGHLKDNKRLDRNRLKGAASLIFCKSLVLIIWV